MRGKPNGARITVVLGVGASASALWADEWFKATRWAGICRRHAGQWKCTLGGSVSSHWHSCIFDLATNITNIKRGVTLFFLLHSFLNSRPLQNVVQTVECVVSCLQFLDVFAPFGSRHLTPASERCHTSILRGTTKVSQFPLDLSALQIESRSLYSCF